MSAPSVPFLSILLALAVLAVLVVPAMAEEDAPVGRDRIHMTNGRIFEGRIIAEDDCGVTLDLASPTGGCGRMLFPRRLIVRIERGVGGDVPRPSAGFVRDAWYLLRSGDMLLGARHLVLRHVQSGDAKGWRLEETLEHFARGPRIPAVRIQRAERVGLAFHPLEVLFREVGEGSGNPDGPRRYERILSGPVRSGVWEALIHDGVSSERRRIPLPPDGRSRLGTREHVLHRRKVGLQQIAFLDPAVPGVATALVGYTALDVVDRTGRMYDEFVWQEDGVRLISRFKDFEVVEEAVADGVVAVPATRAQVDAAREEGMEDVSEEEPGVVKLAEIGISFRLPDTAWKAARSEIPPFRTGWRKVAVVESRLHVTDVRIEWDPDGVAVAPGQAEAADRLLQRLRAVCPDLRVVHPRRPLPVDDSVQGAWRMDFTGTLKEEAVRTVAVVLDQGQGRVLVLVACPEVAWPQASRSIEVLLASIRRL